VIGRRALEPQVSVGVRAVLTLLRRPVGPWVRCPWAAGGLVFIRVDREGLATTWVNGVLSVSAARRRGTPARAAVGLAQHTGAGTVWPHCPGFRAAPSAMLPPFAGAALESAGLRV